MQHTNTDSTGLPGEYTEPATFSTTANLQRVAENAAPWVGVESAAQAETRSPLVNTNLRESVLLAGTLHGVMTQAVADARRAAFVHLMATLNLACVLRALQQQATALQIPVLALYKGYKGNPTAQEHAMKLTGGAAIPFTYATARNYIKVLDNVQSRMQLEGGMTSAQVVQVLCDHSAALTSGAYDDPMAATESLWAPFLTAGSLRAAYLELAPEKPGLRERLENKTPEDAVDTEQPVTFDALRRRFLTKFGGWYDQLSGFVTELAPRVAPQDRELIARKLEEEAARIRSMKTNPMAAVTALPHHP